MIGTVIWFDDSKGYGFIELTNGKQIFVHYTEIQKEGYKSLDVGSVVELDLYDGAKGPIARNVRLLT